VVGSTELAGFGQVSSSETTLVFHLCFRSPSDLWDTLASTRLNRVYQGIIRLYQHVWQDGYSIMCSAFIQTWWKTFSCQIICFNSIPHLFLIASLRVYNAYRLYTQISFFWRVTSVIYLFLIYLPEVMGNLSAFNGRTHF
jgi:hypothetical protein